MNIQAEKIELAKMLLETDDEKLLEQIKNLFEKREKDFWEDLPNHVKEGIENSLQQAKEGLITPHADVMKKYEKYL